MLYNKSSFQRNLIRYTILSKLNEKACKKIAVKSYLMSHRPEIGFIRIKESDKVFKKKEPSPNKHRIQ